MFEESDDLNLYLCSTSGYKTNSAFFIKEKTKPREATPLVQGHSAPTRQSCEMHPDCRVSSRPCWAYIALCDRPDVLMCLGVQKRLSSPVFISWLSTCASDVPSWFGVCQGNAS